MIAGILLGILTGLLANELCEFSPWCARKLVRWSAFRQYTDQGRAERRAEEWTAVINDRPGNLFKLITAVGFTATAVIVSGRRAVGRGSEVRLDPKLGLLNATTWEREAAVEIARAVKTGSPFALALVEIDHFELVNETFGHLVGDKALRVVADGLRSQLRVYDLAGRGAGEEFAILLPQAREVDAIAVAERLRRHIATMTIPVNDNDESGLCFKPTISVGVAAVDGVSRELTDVLAAADSALCYAQQTGRNKTHVITAVAAQP